MAFCLPQAKQDLENARRTAQTYIISGTWDPTAVATEASKGTFFLRIGAAGGTAYQKQDDGCTVNWSPVASFSGLVSEQLIKYVDIGNGSDITGDGTKNKPYQTITAALNSIVDATTNKRYMIFIAPGVYPENIVWKDWISAMGFGYESTRLTGTFNHTNISPSGDAGRLSFTNIAFDGASTTLNHAASSNINIRFFHCRILNMIYTGPPNYGIGSAGNLFLHNSVLLFGTINDAALHMYEGGAIFGGLTINDAAVVFAELQGVELQGAINLNGRAELYTRGCFNIATVTGANVGGNDPYWDTDTSSFPYSSVVGRVNVQIASQTPKTITAAMSPYSVNPSDSVLLCDASGGPVNLLLPPVASLIGKRLSVKKIDASANPVSLDPNGGDLMDGVAGPGAVVLGVQWQSVDFTGNALAWYIL